MKKALAFTIALLVSGPLFATNFWSENGKFEAVPSGAGATGYIDVQDEGVDLVKRSTMNFVGAGVTASDSGGVTTITIPGASSGYSIYPATAAASLAQGMTASTMSASQLTLTSTGTNATQLTAIGVSPQTEPVVRITSGPVSKVEIYEDGKIRFPNVVFGGTDKAGLDWFCLGAWGRRIRPDTTSGDIGFYNTTSAEVLQFQVGDTITLSPTTVIVKPSGLDFQWGSTALGVIPVNVYRYTGTNSDAYQIKTYINSGASQQSRFRITQGDTTGDDSLKAKVIVENAKFFGENMATSSTATVYGANFQVYASSVVTTVFLNANGGFRLGNTYTIATLPTAALGMQAVITDGDAGLAWGATAINSGAGATKYFVWYNGTNWTVTGK